MSQFPSTGPGAAQQQGSTRLVVIALVVALAAVILMNIYVEVAKSRAAGGTITIYRVTTTLEPGDRVEADDLEPLEVPERFAQTYVNAVKQGPSGQSERLGEVVRRRVEANQFLEYEHFTEDRRDELISQIQTGKRLIALPVEPDILPSIRPGMQVDIEAPFAGGGAVTDVLTIMEDVRIMAVGQRSVIEERQEEGGNRRLGNYRTISIQVDPEQATQLSKIQKIIVGPFELHIRPPDDPSRKLQDADGNPIYGINPKVLEKIGEEPN